MYIKGGMKKLSKAIAKSSKEAFDKEIAIAQQEEDQINQMMEEQEKANMPILNEDRKLVELDDGSKLDDMSIKEKIGTWKHNFSQLDPHNKFFYLLEQGRGIVEPLPTGSALMFPSFTHMHRGLPVQTGDRYLLVFWLISRPCWEDKKNYLEMNFI